MTGAMDERQWVTAYFERYRQSIFGVDMSAELIRLKDLLLGVRRDGTKVILAGNGGSAAIASHCAVDLTKNAGVRSVNFNEADLITCFANDYGYERWLEKALEFYADDGDVAILISSSGQSANMCRAAEYASGRGLTVVTFTGFDETNPLKKFGALNFWVPSRAYNVVEMTHQIWLLAVCDLIIGSAEYPASAAPRATDSR